MVVVIVFLGLAAPSLADPGSPGLGRATEAVYTGTHTDFGQRQLGSGTQSSSSGAVGEGTGLPFTGLLAPAMLVLGLAVLGLGLGARTITRE